MTREDVTFPSQGTPCAGWFYPAHGEAAAVVVMAHGLAGVRQMRLDAYAERFAAAGYHVLVFDYRHFGASGGEPRQLLSIRHQHQDWEAAVGYARSRPEAAGLPLVLWGSSLSGGHVLALAERLEAAAVIAQVPHTDGLAGVLAIPPTTSVRLVGHALRDVAAAALRRGPHYVPAQGEPGSVALMTDPEAAGYQALVPEGEQFDNRVAARFALAIGLYSPGRALKGLDIPVLVQVAEDDRTTPPTPALKYAAKAARATVRRYPSGHFEPYLGDLFEQFVGDQIAFLDEVLPRRS